MGNVPERSKAERFSFIALNRSDFGVRYLCRYLNVSPQGFYKWLNRDESTRDIENRRILRRIEAIYTQHDGNYGSPRISAELKANGERINHKRVERLMREAGIVGKAGRIYRRRPLPGNPCIKVENLQREHGMPSKPDSQWAGDVTYLKINGQWQYLAVIIDLYSRKVLGWELSDTRTVELTLSALNKAVRRRNIESNLIFHSDRGSEYGAYAYQNRLKELDIEPSMNRPGFMNDNVYVESFFQTLKTESFKGFNFKSVEELRTNLAWYLDRYYNFKRRHGSLGFKSPDEYERMAA
ncbi:IS3 family transposase [Microbulbifer sp. CNSA002]|uniref:IS3 family transposase n=1 Tax=Microbulbifer sp. CNSA002 TaxID=3373604 RepID=UPI0039B580B1